MTEEICGRFGSFRRIECLYIALLGFMPDDGVSASLFGGATFLLERMYIRQMTFSACLT